MVLEIAFENKFYEDTYQMFNKMLKRALMGQEENEDR